MVVQDIFDVGLREEIEKLYDIKVWSEIKEDLKDKMRERFRTI